MVYNREEVPWARLLVVLSKDFFGQRHCADQKEADLCRNEDKYLGLSYACLLKKKKMEKSGF